MPDLRRRLNERWDLVLIVLLLTYFAVRLGFFATRIDGTVPPDEIDHLGRSQAFAEALWLPAEAPELYRFGAVSKRPFLQYLIHGKLLWVKPPFLSDLLYLRLINALMGVLVVVFGLRWIRLLTPNRRVHVLFVALITNILMFVGVSASVSYDNLTNLLAAMALFYLFAFFENPAPRPLGLLGVSVLAGCLTKQAFWPLALILLVVLVVRFRHPASWKPSSPGWARAWLTSGAPWKGDRATALVWALLAVLLVANLHLFGGNLLRYGKLIASPVDLYGLEGALQNRIFARDYVIRQFQDGQISFEEALEQADAIENRGNRRRARNVLIRLRDPGAFRASLLSPEVYFPVWFRIMLSRVVGYDGHRVMHKTNLELAPYFLLIVSTLLLFIRKAGPGEVKGYPLATGFVALAYGFVLIAYVHYPKYLQFGVPDFFVQGRYVFPVLVPLCGLAAFYSLTYLPERLQGLVGFGVAAIFIYGDFPYFLTRVNPCWFHGTATWPQCLMSL